MSRTLQICVSVLCLVSLAGAGWADTIFTTEPRTPLRPRPGLRLKAFKVVPWGTPFERVKTVETWSRVSVNDSLDAFIWGDFITTYDIVDASTVGKNVREVCFTVGKYLGKPVWEAICEHIVKAERAKSENLRGLTLKGYLASQYPGGDPLCTGRWARGTAAEGALEIAAAEVEPPTNRDEELYDAAIQLFKSEDRKGKSIYAVEEVWTQMGEEYGISKQEARFRYDRVRWYRAGMLER